MIIKGVKKGLFNTPKSWGQSFVKSPSLANGENKLNEHCDDIKVAFFGFCPKEWRAPKEAVYRRKHRKIYISDDVRSIKIWEKVPCDF